MKRNDYQIIHSSRGRGKIFKLIIFIIAITWEW